MHLQLAVDVDDNGKHTITATNLMPGVKNAFESLEESLDTDEVADELIGIVADCAADHGFELPVEDDLDGEVGEDEDEDGDDEK